jgi:hypothetical protein
MSTIPITQLAADYAPIACTLAPIACTLTPAQHRSRTRDLSDLARRALLTREPIDGGERLTFADSPAVERELSAAVAAEASCCSFLTMRLDRRDAGLVLDVTGPADARPMIAELFA